MQTLRRKITLLSETRIIAVFLVSFLIFVGSGAMAVTRIPSDIHSNIHSTVLVGGGRLEVSYSSKPEELRLTYYLPDEEKEYSVSLDASEPVGVLVIAEGKRLKYSVDFLNSGSGRDWDPLSDISGEVIYERRMELDLSRGWRVLVVEKIGQFSA